MTINFGAGPAKVPREVLLQAQREFLDYDGTGISVTELSHRSATFAKILDAVERNVRELLAVPEDYAVLFMHGGACGQMAAVPMNLCGGGGGGGSSVDYIVTGAWSEKAAKEAAKYCSTNVIRSTSLTDVPDASSWRVTQGAKYLYYCDNETIHGVEFDKVPEGVKVPLVCDMTSNLFTRPVDVKKFGCIFAGTQKNAGIASLTLVIVRKDLIAPLNTTPAILDYKVTIGNKSLQNTPNCFAIYMTGLCLDWIKRNGGLDGMAALAQERSSLIYSVIDASDGFYHNPVEKRFRSRVTVPFRVGGAAGDAELEKKFLSEAEARGMIQLKGHRSVGGIRASMYNAMLIEEVRVLADFMREFQSKNK